MAQEQLALRDEAEESFTGASEELPAQGGSFTPTILPGRSLFRLPANLDQCWETKDYEKKDAAGNVLHDQATGQPVVEQHLLLKMDDENPMIIVGGPYDGLPAQSTITTIARRRGKKSDKDAPMVHDLTYLVRTSLQDQTPVLKRKDWIPLVNKYAGHLVHLEHGLSAQCSPERVRYIDDGSGQGIEDPDGTMGCDHAAGPAMMEDGTFPASAKKGSRLYTKDFSVSRVQDTTSGNVYNSRDEAIEAGAQAADLKNVTVFVDTVYCKGCGARLRGFFRIEKFLAPLASTQIQG